MSQYDLFYEQVKKHLAGFNSWGAWRNKGKTYPYIANIEGKNKQAIIREIIKSDKVPTDLYRHPHKDAHHLNSSQVVCYEFFRPMMRINPSNPEIGLADKKLIRFVKDIIGINISENSVCQFEYEDKETKALFKSYTQNGIGERSQFDFFIKDGETEIYFEIKYTEQSFGPWSPSKKTEDQIKNHCLYVEKGYIPMLINSPYFTQECKDTLLSFQKDDFASLQNPFNAQYQLFRNALKAGKSKYSIFIFPAANPNPGKEFEVFEKNLLDGQSHILALKWEELKQYMSERFYKKFIDLGASDAIID